MRGIALAALVSGCSFTPGAFVARDAAPDGTTDGAADAFVAPDARACFGAAPHTVCFTVVPTGAVPITGDIDTDSSTLCSTSVMGTSPGCVIAADTVTVAAGAAVTAHGMKPLVLVGVSAITVAGTIDVASHRGGQTGAGAIPTSDATSCNAGTAPGTNGGGAGGSLAGTGGDGGNTNKGIAGATLTITAVRGGCYGQNGASGAPGTGGMGGGALVLIAGSSITLATTTSINASGAGATPAASGGGGGGGGGSGGLIVFDAPTVALAGLVLANGGGGSGGAGSSTAGCPGSDPSGVGPAGGGAAVTPCSTNGGSGGAGGAQGSAAQTGAAPGGGATYGGGGGGGGVGVIDVIGTQSGSPMISPTPT